MAILKKRRSTASLPQAKTENGVIVSGRPGDRLTSEIKGRPTSGAAPSRAPTAKTTTGARPSLSLTSATKPAVTNSRPTGSATAPKGNSITTKVAGTAKPALTSRTVNTSSGSGLGNTLKNALAGAAVGVAGKTVLDKVLGTNKTTTPGGTRTNPTTTGGTKTTTGGTTTTTGGTRTNPGTTTSTTTGGTKTTTTGTTTTDKTKLPTGGTKTTPGGTKTTTTGTTGGTKTTTTGSTRPTVPVGTRPTGGTGGTRTTGGGRTPGSGTTPTRGMGGTGAAAGSTGQDDQTETAEQGDGTQTFTYDDGSTITVDADGNIISATDADGNAVDMSGDSTTSEEDTFGGVTNDDGSITYTMDDGSTITVDANGDVISSTDAVDDGTGDDTQLADGEQYFQDDDGNIYDASGNLIYAVGEDGTLEEYQPEDEYASLDEYTDDEGNIYNANGELIYDASADQVDTGEDYAYTEEDVPVEDAYTDDTYAYDDSGSYDEYESKRGGLVALMAGGGDVRAFQDGGDEGDVVDEEVVSTPYIDENAADAEYFDDGSYIIYYGDGSSITYDSDGAVYQVDGGDDSEAVAAMDIVQGDDETPMTRSTSASGYGDNVQVFDDGSRIETFDDGSTITYDSDGNIAGSTGGYDTEVDENGNYVVSDGYGNVVGVYDQNGNAVTPSITGAGGAGAGAYREEKTPQQRALDQIAQKKADAASKGALSNLSDWFKENPTLGAGAAGALIGTLLGDSNIFGSDSGQRNAGIDMSKVGYIAPRTTDFGIGPANFVTYNEYAARDQMPDLYGNELYRNLNAPGFNPVNEGDYGYAGGDNEQAEPTQDNEAQEPHMADGGATGTYFTFGKVVDPLQNLMHPQPEGQSAALPPMGGLNAQQQPKPQMPLPQVGQQPPQPQLMQAMKSGGLPAVSNVPLTAGRLDFRQGSAVHGPGDGQSDDIPAMLADGEYVIDAETVAQIGNGSTKAGAKALDEFRMNIRKHKRSAPLDKIPPKTKALTSYLKKGN